MNKIKATLILKLAELNLSKKLSRKLSRTLSKKINHPKISNWCWEIIKMMWWRNMTFKLDYSLGVKPSLSKHFLLRCSPPCFLGPSAVTWFFERPPAISPAQLHHAYITYCPPALLATLKKMLHCTVVWIEWLLMVNSQEIVFQIT